MIELDGSDGGGQLVRTALTLSALRGEPFRMEGVRGDRSTPGLKRQHLACVEAVAALTDAAVEGDAVGSETLTFEPAVEPGSPGGPADVAVDVGTAGSVTLVADTLLPLAVRLRTPVRASLVGGTDVRWAPSTAYLRRVKLPLLRRLGLDATVDPVRRGFYPAGGGELAVEIRPSSLDPVDLRPGGDAASNPGSAAASDAGGEATPVTGRDGRASVHAIAAAGLEADDVAERVAEATEAELDDRGIVDDVPATATYADADSTGVALTVAIDGDSGAGRDADPAPRAGFVGYGGADADPESLADTTADAVERWAGTAAPVDAHLADQLVVWLALAGGSVPTPRVTDHVRTNVALVRAFGYDVSIDRRPDGASVVAELTD